MKPIHMAEVLASLDIPTKITIPAFAVASQIYAGNWDAVREACENDVISTALLLARWRKLHDPRAEAGAVIDRILRRVIDLRAGRKYVEELKAYRARSFARSQAEAIAAMQTLAPWLEDAA